MTGFMHDLDNEFYKLDALDKRLFFEILEKHEKSMDVWIDHISEDYARKGISIDNYKFKMEVQKFQDFLQTEEDNYKAP